MTEMRLDSITSSRGPQARLRVAAIMDPFTLSCFAPEFELLELGVDTDLATLAAFSPHFLFVESAFYGKDGRWWGKIGGRSIELKRVLRWCNDNSVPTVFWNKEDPVHFRYFIKVASEFDHVFTTDINCIPEYKRRLAHDRVHLLPFAAQPRLHNPVERYERQDAVCFAGSYYTRFPERSKNLEEIIFSLSRLKKVEIYNRHWGDKNYRYIFPQKYDQFIIGGLPHDEIEKAYKGYIYSLNLNTVKQSSTMYARRVFELLASNAIVVSNFSRGMRLMFGDTVISSDSGAEIVKCLRDVIYNDEIRSKRRLAGLRKVVLEHLYAHRVAQIVRTVLGIEYNVSLTGILVVAHAATSTERDRLIDGFRHQTHPDRRMILACETEALDVRETTPGVEILSLGELGDAPLHRHLRAGEWVAAMVPQDYYGPNYLLDLAITARLCNASMTGKIARYVVEGGSVHLVKPEAAYRPINATLARCGAIEGTLIPATPIAEWIRSLPDTVWQHADGIASDPFNYCENATAACPQTEIEKRVGDLDIHQGISLDRLFEAANQLSARKHSILSDRRLSAGALKAKAKRIAKAIPKLRYFWQVIGHSFGNIWNALRVIISQPQNVVEFLRKIKSRPDFAPEPSCFIGSGTYLLVTNIYPRYGFVYSNYFVHTRVRAYLDRGIAVDVFCLNDEGEVSFDEFQGVNVVRGNRRDLECLLSSNHYSTVMVHFLTPTMWSVIEKYARALKTVIWAHGYEIQPLHRRFAAFRSPVARLWTKWRGQGVARFWRKLLRNPPPGVAFVFVSNYLVGTVVEDLTVQLPQDRCHVIHNPIDTERFGYRKKPVEQRLRILSIRSFHSDIYANDMSVKVIEGLSSKPFFHLLQIRIVGDGRYFEKITKPLRKFSNVTLERRFLPQEDIAALHQDFGIFLCPTRADTQGVSRDEAMASGLVPITNAIQAIPEFVDPSCGMLAPAEDVEAMIKAIEDLVADPARFQSMSEAAARRVRQQSALANVISDEIALFAQP